MLCFWMNENIGKCNATFNTITSINTFKNQSSWKEKKKKNKDLPMNRWTSMTSKEIREQINKI